jgi:phytoene desaturase (3,4-didehydrolycopene-forming)
LLLLPKLFKETFHDLGTSLPSEGVQLLKCEPNYNLWFGDGESFELSSDTAVMKREIEKWEGKEGFQRYLAWLSEAHAHYEISVTEVLHKNFGSMLSFFDRNFLRNLTELHPFESIYSRASRYFYTERLRRVFTFGSMYMGMSPFDAPGTYSLLQYTELAEGIWYPVGGFHAVIAALVKVGERLGVKYRLNTPVSSVSVSPDGKTVTGVILDSGEILSADIVVVNADLVYAYNNLFPSPQSFSADKKPSSSSSALSSTSSYAKSLSKRAGSCSSISFYWALSQKIPQLETHNIFLADSYKESFDAIFKRQSIPDEPSFYVNVPSRIDPSAAPPDCDSIVVLVPVGHLLKSRTNSDPKNLSNGNLDETNGRGIERELDLESHQDWDKIVTLARDKIISTISTRLSLPPSLLSSSIIHEDINTPQSWESTFNLDKGSILGLSHSFFNVLAFRPGIRHKKLKGAYFVGASTHPGTGVPIVLAGAKMTAEAILGDLGLQMPWSGWEEVVNDKGVRQGKGTRAIDRVQTTGWWSYFQGPLLAPVLLIMGMWYQVFDRFLVVPLSS